MFAWKGISLGMIQRLLADLARRQVPAVAVEAADEVKPPAAAESGR